MRAPCYVFKLAGVEDNLTTRRRYVTNHVIFAGAIFAYAPFRVFGKVAFRSLVAHVLHDVEGVLFPFFEERTLDDNGLAFEFDAFAGLGGLATR